MAAMDLFEDEELQSTQQQQQDYPSAPQFLQETVRGFENILEAHTVDSQEPEKVQYVTISDIFEFRLFRLS